MLNRPHPLRTRAFLSALAAALLGAAVLFGWVDPADVSRIEAVVALFLTAGVAGGAVAASGERVVTPTADPRDDEGRPLYPR